MNAPTLTESELDARLDANQPEKLDWLMAELLAHYGSDWTHKWSGVAVSSLRMNWARNVGGFSAWTIRRVLETLPERAPNASEFRGMCMRAPARPGLARLPAPAPQIDRVKRELAAIYERIAVKPPWERGKVDEIQNVDERKRAAAEAVARYGREKSGA